MNGKLRSLLEKQTIAFAMLSASLIRQLMSVWNSTENDEWYDGDLVRAKAARSATIVEAAQSVARKQARVYMKLVYAQFPDLPFPTDAEIDAENEELLDRLITPLEEWDRPAEQYRYAKSTGVDVTEAKATALQRVDDLGDMDLALARRGEYNKIFKATPKVKYYRRVLHPELSSTGTSCGLCIAASTRLYKKKDLLPLHDHCHCDVMPVLGEDDPGQQFNEDDLKQLYSLAGGTGSQQLSRVRYKIDQHGELGPYLVEQGSNRSAGRKLAPKVTNKVVSIQAQLDSLNNSLPRLLDRKKQGENVDQAIQWQKDRIAQLQAEQKNITAKRRKK